MQDSRSTGDDSWWFDRAKEVVVVRPSTDALTRDSNYIDNVYKRPTFSNELQGPMLYTSVNLVKGHIDNSLYRPLRGL